MSKVLENAQIEAKVKDFLSDWYSIEALYKTAAKAGSLLINLVSLSQLSEEDIRVINALLEQHLMMTELIDKFSPDEL